MIVVRLPVCRPQSRSARCPLRVAAALLILIATVNPLTAQETVPGRSNGGAENQINRGETSGAGASDVSRGQGGAANADFDSLIDLIVSTVATETWAENGGGDADVRPFPGGVLVEPTGMLRLRSDRGGDAALARKRGKAPPAETSIESGSATNPVRSASELRFVSLPRLEREIARRLSAREPLDPSMLALAGLQRVRYVFAYPETGDLVLAGPAGDWQVDRDGRLVATHSKAPIVRLDDLLVLLRRSGNSDRSYFGCSINPRQESLANAQAFLASTRDTPLEPGMRKQWLRELRDRVGIQDIEIFGIDPASRVASVLVAADYHMKLIGMGLVDGVEGVESYLDSIQVARGEAPRPMSVLRWWFTLDYRAIASAPDCNAFELVGQGARVRSENEMLAERGVRVHTGQSDPQNTRFAEAFTKHFAELAAIYPVYGELRNIFDLAMAVALIDEADLKSKVGWEPSLFVRADLLRLPTGPVPRQVETVIAHRVIQRRHIVAGVSGGVLVAPSDLLKASPATEKDNRPLGAKRLANSPAEGGAIWWWDATE